MVSAIFRFLCQISLETTPLQKRQAIRRYHKVHAWPSASSRFRKANQTSDRYNTSIPSRNPNLGDSWYVLGRKSVHVRIRRRDHLQSFRPITSVPTCCRRCDENHHSPPCTAKYGWGCESEFVHFKVTAYFLESASSSSSTPKSAVNLHHVQFNTWINGSRN